MYNIDKKLRDISEISDNEITDSDIKRMRRIAELLHLSDNDPFLSVLSTLDNYERIYKKTQKEITNDVSDLNACFYYSGIVLTILLFFVFVFYNFLTDEIKIKDYIIREQIIKVNNKDAFFRSKFFDDVYKLYESGDLERIVYCKKRGWKIENDECVPKAYKDEKGEWWISTWKIPQTK